MQRIDTNQMLASGAIEGPYRPTRPVTITWRKKLMRAVLAALRDFQAWRLTK